MICQQLGYETALNATIMSFYGEVPQDLFSYDEVNCTGVESTLENCSHDDAHDCKLNEGAGVICKV